VNIFKKKPTEAKRPPKGGASRPDNADVTDPRARGGPTGAPGMSDEMPEGGDSTRMSNVHPIRQTNEDEAEIRQAIENFSEAFRAKDLEKIVACYAPGIVAFDLMPPLQHVGIEAWREVWAKSLPMMQGQITLEFRDLKIDVSNDLGVCRGLHHFRMTGAEEVEVWLRWTACFRKMNGKWLVIHEHTSVPADMENGKALMQLKP